eukprot:COSAG05_NODE_1810_length_4040_cov_11.771885_1_plen_132_part_00
MMIGFRSDHACIMHKSETDWMHALGKPASARAWPAASGQLAVLCDLNCDFWATQSRHDIVATLKTIIGRGPALPRATQRTTQKPAFAPRVLAGPPRTSCSMSRVVVKRGVLAQPPENHHNPRVPPTIHKIL